MTQPKPAPKNPRLTRPGGDPMTAEPYICPVCDEEYCTCEDDWEEP